MKLTNYIQEHHNGNISDFARANNYHPSQVHRCINQGGEIDTFNDDRPYFKKYLKQKQGVDNG